MPNRPSRSELLLRFFPGIQDDNGGDTEAARAINVRACEAILADLIDLYDEGLQEHGQGMLALRLFKGARHSGYVTLADLQHDLEASQAFGDQPAVDFFTDTINTVRTHNPGQAALFSLADNSRCQVIAVGRDNPAASISALMEDVSS